MGRPEDLPEVVPPPPAPLPEYDAGPQVVSDHDGSAHQVQLDESQRNKYPADYGNEPKIPLDPSQSPVSTESTYQQQWLDQQQHQNWLLAPGIGHPVSALSPANSSAPWSTIHPGAGFGGDSRFGDEEACSSDMLQPPPPPEEKRICGIPRRIFIVMVIFSLIVIAAAVGGGVGGALKARQGEENLDTAAQQSGAAGDNSNPTRTSNSPTSKTSPKPKPTYTSLFDETTIEDGFAFQAYSGINGTGNRTQIYTEEGFFDFGFKAKSYMWQPGARSCCITFCAANNATGKKTNKQALGWWCDARKQNETTEAFPRLHIWCGRWSNTEQQEICQKPKMIERDSEFEGERTWFSLPLF